MTEDALAALSALTFTVAPAPDDVWKPSPYHVEELHRTTGESILAGLGEARNSDGASPVGVVVVGQRGAGKTHLLGWVRERTQAADGFFFLVGVLDADRFWASLVEAMISGLTREVAGRPTTQLQSLLQRLATELGAPRNIRRAVSGDTALSRDALDMFVTVLRQRMRDVGRESQDAVRALALLASDDPDAQDIGEAYLSSQDEIDEGERERWGIRRRLKSPKEIVRDLSRVLALVGPAVIAVDQIDTLVAQTRRDTASIGGDDDAATAAVKLVAHDLMSLRELTRRTLTVLACIPATWDLIKRRSTDTVQDRFRETVQLGAIPTPEIGLEVVRKRLAGHYTAVGFAAPYPTWPILPAAFAEAPNRTPRQVLQRVDAHIRACVLDKQVRELARLTAADPLPSPRTPPAPSSSLAAIDASFARLRAAADVSQVRDHRFEDALLPSLLNAGLTAWITELGDAGRAFSVDPPFGSKPALHARLRRTLDEQTEDELHWSFRGIAAEHPVAALTRLRKACVVSGITEGSTTRRLFLIRNWEWSRGPATGEAVRAFTAAHGRRIGLGDDDIRVLAALRDLLAENPPGLRSWIEARLPTRDVRLLREALGGAAGPAPGESQGNGVAAARPDLVRPAAGREPATSREPAAGREPAMSDKPVAGREPVMSRESVMSGEPVVGREPAAGREAVVSREPVVVALPVGDPATTVGADGSGPGGSRALTGALTFDGDRSQDPIASVAAGAAPGAGAHDGARASARADDDVADGRAEEVNSAARAVDPGHAALASDGDATGTGEPIFFDVAPALAGPTRSQRTVDPSGRRLVAIGVARVPPGIRTDPAPQRTAFTLGTTLDGGRPFALQLESLRKHTVIFAGSGSGKTVLIRRLIEECALRGVSSIVLDPNNDLARLGDPWPVEPAGWGEGDAAAAARYLDGTDVVVWTPRRAAGRPLSFQPLPDFQSVLDDVDEFNAAIDAAVASLAPRAKVDGATTRANLGQAVLRESLRYYARNGGVGLRGFLRTLQALPDGVSTLDRAEKIANDLAQALTAATVNDPLFGGDGAPLDPGVLLTPPPGRRARVSVISLVGLPSDDQRQSFVNQLQMALFAWIKRHPAGDRPLGGLLVMDEAQTLAPSGAMTACTQSTIALASQARKYGLGLVFATQAPKALHNRIPGNAATQLFGFLNAPVQIAAAKEMAAAKGGGVADISRLRTGQFYAALEGTPLTRIATPLCLSYHPSSPLTTEEVIDRARRG